MKQTHDYFSDILRTFDGRTHSVTANKVEGTWRAHATIDGQIMRGRGATTLERAIGNFRECYQVEFDR